LEVVVNTRPGGVNNVIVNHCLSRARIKLNLLCALIQFICHFIRDLIDISFRMSDASWGRLIREANHSHVLCVILILLLVWLFV
jgi:hypothetical protein